jgi:hypothetical protein
MSQPVVASERGNSSWALVMVILTVSMFYIIMSENCERIKYHLNNANIFLFANSVISNILRYVSFNCYTVTQVYTSVIRIYSYSYLDM